MFQKCQDLAYKKNLLPLLSSIMCLNGYSFYIWLFPIVRFLACIKKRTKKKDFGISCSGHWGLVLPESIARRCKSRESIRKSAPRASLLRKVQKLEEWADPWVGIAGAWAPGVKGDGKWMSGCGTVYPRKQPWVVVRREKKERSKCFLHLIGVCITAVFPRRLAGWANPPRDQTAISALVLFSSHILFIRNSLQITK